MECFLKRLEAAGYRHSGGCIWLPYTGETALASRVLLCRVVAGGPPGWSLPRARWLSFHQGLNPSVITMGRSSFTRFPSADYDALILLFSEYGCWSLKGAWPAQAAARVQLSCADSLVDELRRHLEEMQAELAAVPSVLARLNVGSGW